MKAPRREDIQADLHFQRTVECINQLPDLLRRWMLKCDPTGALRRAIVAEDLWGNWTEALSEKGEKTMVSQSAQARITTSIAEAGELFMVLPSRVRL